MVLKLELLALNVAPSGRRVGTQCRAFAPSLLGSLVYCADSLNPINTETIYFYSSLTLSLQKYFALYTFFCSERSTTVYLLHDMRVPGNTKVTVKSTVSGLLKLSLIENFGRLSLRLHIIQNWLKTTSPSFSSSHSSTSGHFFELFGWLFL